MEHRIYISNTPSIQNRSLNTCLRCVDLSIQENHCGHAVTPALAMSAGVSMYVWIPRPVLTDSLPPDLLHAASLAHSSGPPASPVTHCKCILSALEWPASCECCVAQSWVVQRARPQPHPHPQVRDCAADVIIDRASESSLLPSNSAKQNQSVDAPAIAIATSSTIPAMLIRTHFIVPSSYKHRAVLASTQAHFAAETRPCISPAISDGATLQSVLLGNERRSRAE